jgi:hypothetical protein
VTNESNPAIGGVVFDGDRAPTTGAEVRDYHVTIKGVDSQGRRYHALNPDVFYWAHATFFVGTCCPNLRSPKGFRTDSGRFSEKCWRRSSFGSIAPRGVT